MLNRATIIGRLGQDVTLMYTPTGIPFARFNVATSTSFKDANGNPVEKTDWHRVVVFKRIAENCANFLHRGSLVYVEGSMSTRKWQDQQGQDRYTTEITSRRVQFLDRKPEAEQPQAPEDELPPAPVTASMMGARFFRKLSPVMQKSFCAEYLLAFIGAAGKAVSRCPRRYNTR